MSFLNDLIGDLREKRLWPVVVVLVGALVAVPVLLAKPAPKSTAVATTPPPSGGVAAPPGLPVVSVAAASTNVRIHGKARDPFAQHAGRAPKVTNSTGSTPTTSSSTAGAGGSSSTGGGGSGSKGTGGTSGGSTQGTGGTGSPSPGSPEPIPLPKPKPAPAGLTDTEAYHVTVEITNGRGGVDKLDPLERLSILPSAQQPLLVELGVLDGGRSVLFVLQQGAVVNGPGHCVPGPIDCQILSLGQDQVETISQRAASGVFEVAAFAVTGISADHYSSAAAARAARAKVSAAGQRLLRGNTDSALPLFPYELGSGTVVDQRNLTVGAS